LQEVCCTDGAVAVEVRGFKTVVRAAEELEKHEQVVCADEPVIVDVACAKAQLVGAKQAVAIVVITAVRAGRAWVDVRIVVVAVAQVRPLVVVVVHNAGAFVESRFAIVQSALGTGFLAQKGASEQAIVHDARNLFAETPDAIGSEFKLSSHAGFHALLPFAEAVISAFGGDALNKFSVLADVVQISISAIACALGQGVDGKKTDRQSKNCKGFDGLFEWFHVRVYGNFNRKLPKMKMR
jgi:hypothetical protein